MTGALLTFLAQAQPPGADRGEEFGKSSPIALVVILLLLIATILLIRSMGKHLRKVPESFETTGDAEQEDGTDDGPDDAEAPADGAAATPEGGARAPDRHSP